jgi:ubiquinone/menaquinone biosynthesis C-methylase UbiE
MKRAAIAELLDTDSGTPAEIAGSLSDLRWFNQHFGGISTAESMIRRVAAKFGVSSLSLLEVAAGSGYVPGTARQHLKQDGLRLEITLLDRAPSHLDSTNSNGGNRAVVGDALALPFPDSSFDLVSSTLFAHHFTPPQIVQFVNEGLRVCRAAVLINDLVRQPLHLALAYLGSPLYRSRITRHDAPVSVRQAYTEEEMLSLLAQTAAAQVDITRHYLFRMGVIAWKR